MAVQPRFEIWYCAPATVPYPGYAPIRMGRLDIIQSAKYSRIRNAVGSFEVVVPWTAETEQAINQITHAWLIEFTVNGVFEMGGYVTRKTFSFSGPVPTFTISGPGYLGWIADRRLVTSTGVTPYVIAAGTQAGTVLRNMWLNNLTDAAVRRHPIVTWTIAPPTTQALTAQSMSAMDSGLEAFQFIASLLDNMPLDTSNTATNGAPRIWFDIVRTAMDQIEPSVWTPRPGANKAMGSDNPSPVVLDVASGNISNLDYTEDSSAVVNGLFGLGDGDGATRAIYVTQYAVSIVNYGFKEGTLDASQDTDPLVIYNKMADYLKDKLQAQTSLKFSYQSTPDIAYGSSFRFGDRITIYWRDVGLVVTDDVTAVTVTLGSGNSLAGVDLVVGNEQMALGSDARRLGRTLMGLRRALAYMRH